MTPDSNGIPATGKYKMINKRREHVLVWEAHHGKIPEGYETHHINGDRGDNRIENLETHTKQDHHRIHSINFEKFNGEWIKFCPDCEAWKPLTEYYARGIAGLSHTSVGSYCKPCKRERALARYYEKRMVA